MRPIYCVSHLQVSRFLLKLPLIFFFNRISPSVSVKDGLFFLTIGTLSRNGSQKNVVMKKAPLQLCDLIDREVAALSQLRHKNIIKLFGRHESEPELVLEIMELGELNSAILVRSLLRTFDC